MTTFTIVPDGEFSLAAAANFGFGPNMGRPVFADAGMTLAFVTDDLAGHAHIRLTQDDTGTVRGTVSSDADLASVENQVRRILSLDRSGADWAKIGQGDPVVGRLQKDHAGLRPVLFHSPYEAAAWSIVSARRHRAQAVVVRNRLSALHGRTFLIDGVESRAFPTPESLLAVSDVQGLDDVRIERLHAVARAALDGQLEPALLLSLSKDDALAHLQTLPGIGPMYSTLILLRSTGATDIMTGLEPRIASYLAHFYRLDHAQATDEEIGEISEGWRPFRTWTSVLTRVAGDALGLPFPASAAFGRRGRA
jgi:DNA-3-methyladenine glycosylase II